ncbi:molecular chaperone [Erwinia sp. OLTSP20]|uniref:fimbria/pilus periplasmic chaperone n=1 Tax=unclassified Erwinia TaxID=2622719 RepID=UPI000C199C5A|nr:MULTISPECIES: fimbria/pilus periplasmic chaperone [unclassified Erwinia]PIJ48164.1 molecular chaperone [Erwinia sp. OAMSP11]PIJ67063.1 molecular chaperone [Erwinia sp. OLSSP12]PIJ78370.1 molecular chaperone [Erwinia sp. OLCASP19]PIJ79121.1 molecular chaperone [Erwinia sp. OLMTSP26]PIJ79978.1 molecular chaperone [Erwinia sp. OLMDSP33]
MKFTLRLRIAGSFVVSLLLLQQASAAISLDRTRIVFDGNNRSMSVNIANDNRELPYLAQGWIEDVNGNKITSPLIVLPPLQRLEPGSRSQLRLQSTPAIAQLPQDKETLYYFNLREVPPKSHTANTLQIALQTRVKLFYRPAGLVANASDYANPWQMQLTMIRNGNHYNVNNPTPYYVTLASAASSLQGKEVEEFEPVMIAPQSSVTLNISAAELGDKPVLSYINDFGGRPKLLFSCAGTRCSVKENKPG